MVNRPKRIGTAAESAVLKQIKPYFPDADRIVLSGAADRGDIGRCGAFIFEVKGGKQTAQIGDGKLAKWMEEAEREAKNAGVEYGILVAQRAGFGLPNARRWWVYVRMQDLAVIMNGFYLPGRFATVRLELGDFLDLLADQGFTPKLTDTGPLLTLPVPVASLLLEEGIVSAPVEVAGYAEPLAPLEPTLFDDDDEEHLVGS